MSMYDFALKMVKTEARGKQYILMISFNQVQNQTKLICVC